MQKDSSEKLKFDKTNIVDLLLTSIAFEELGIANILKAEGELMRLYIDSHKNKNHINYDEIIMLNRNIYNTLRLLLEKEKTLNEKLVQVIQFNEDIGYKNKSYDILNKDMY